MHDAVSNHCTSFVLLRLQISYCKLNTTFNETHILLIFLDLVGCKLGMSKCGPSERSSFQQEGFFSSSRDSLPAAYVNRAANVSSASELDLSRKHRRY